MHRYIQENQRRDELENPNKWWENFSEDVRRFHFMFVAGYFTGKYQEHIDRIALITKTKGAAIEIRELLLKADNIKGKTCSPSDVESCIFT
jgi:hypothetical protein